MTWPAFFYSVLDLASLLIPLYPDLTLLTLACVLDFSSACWLVPILPAWCWPQPCFCLPICYRWYQAFAGMGLSWTRLASCMCRLLCSNCGHVFCIRSSLCIHSIPAVSNHPSDHPLCLDPLKAPMPLLVLLCPVTNFIGYCMGSLREALLSTQPIPGAWHQFWIRRCI